jgi:hypothetical protein
MKRLLISLYLIIIVIFISGCTTTKITDPIIGTWRDQLIGASQMEFFEDHEYHASTLDISYDGNWSETDKGHYIMYFTRSDNKTLLYSATVSYDSVNNTIFIDSQPDIYYSKIVDVIQGNWTDQMEASIMQFAGNYTWRMVIGNVSYDGNWSKINHTCYIVDYTNFSNSTNIYREVIFYNQSDNTIQLENISYTYYSRI